MRFSEFPGNSELKDTFKGLIRENKLAHCLLLTGEQGGGVFPMGLAIASALLCGNNYGEACGECHQCNKYLNKYTYPDLHFTFPIVMPANNKDATCKIFREDWNKFILKSPFITHYNWLDFNDNAQKNGVIPVSEIRDIINFSHLYSYEEGPKVVIIWNADLLGERGNRLLKLIEEPPNNTFIILIAETEENMLNTILSRSQHFHVMNPSIDELNDYLVKVQVRNTREDIENAVLLSDGNASMSIDLLNNNISEQVKMLVPWLRDCYTANAEKLYAWSATFNKFTKEEQKNFWINFLQYLQGLQRIYVKSGTVPRLSAANVAAATNMSSIVNIETLARMYEIINQSIYALERNAKADLAFISASFRLHEVFRLR